MTAFEDIIGYSFQNKKMLTDALTLAHGSKCASYERLEFLGDRVLGLIIADLLLEHYKKENEGDIAKRFTALVREETLAAVARKIGIPKYLITHENELRENDSILADVFEAITGALYRDKGLAAAKSFIQPLFEDLITQKLEPPVDPKTALQEWAHRHKLPLPLYKVLSKTGPDHAPLFIVEVEIKGYPALDGKGHSKKYAEQAAAYQFLQEYADDK